jgi:hypothetical protein
MLGYNMNKKIFISNTLSLLPSLSIKQKIDILEKKEPDLSVELSNKIVLSILNDFYTALITLACDCGKKNNTTTIHGASCSVFNIAQKKNIELGS